MLCWLSTAYILLGFLREVSYGLRWRCGFECVFARCGVCVGVHLSRHAPSCVAMFLIIGFTMLIVTSLVCFAVCKKA